MKKILFAAFCSVCFYNSFAQDISCRTERGKAKRDIGSSVIFSVDDDNAQGVLMVRALNVELDAASLQTVNDGYTFEHYDSAMKLVNSTDYQSSGNGNILGVVVKDGTILFVDYAANSSGTEFVYTAHTATLDGLEFVAKELFRVKTTGIDTRKSVLGAGSRDTDRFGAMFVSQDKTAFGISVDSSKDDKTELHSVYAFDLASLTAKFKQDFKKDISDKKFTIANLQISNDGTTVYLLGQNILEKKARKELGVDFVYEITKLNASGSKTKMIDVDNNYPSMIKAVMKNDKLCCAGFYGGKESGMQFEGACYYDIDPETLDITNKKFNPFTDAFYQDKFGAAKRRDIGRFIIFRNVFLTSNNDIVFNAEEFTVDSSINQGANAAQGRLNAHATAVYKYGDIITIRLNNSGSLLWSHNINKDEEADLYLSKTVSFSALANTDNTYFFFNAKDDPAKPGKTKVEFMKNKKKPNKFYVLRISKDGGINYKELIDYKEDELTIASGSGGSSKQENTVYFTSTGGTDSQVVKMSPQ